MNNVCQGPVFRDSEEPVHYCSEHKDSYAIKLTDDEVKNFVAVSETDLKCDICGVVLMKA